MSAFDISTALANRISSELVEENIGTKYFHQIYNNVHTKSFLVADIPSWPLITVTPGPESYEYQPGAVIWTKQIIYVRAYYKDEYDQERQIQLLLTDLKKVLNNPGKIEYTITNPDGTTEPRYVTIDSFNSLTTDEGVLRPLAVGELAISIKYCADGRVF